MRAYIFGAFGLLWVGGGAYQFLVRGHRQEVIPALVMGAINFALMYYLLWRSDRQQERKRR